MTRSVIDAALAAANPLSERACAALPLHDAETEMVERITAIPVPRPASSPAAPRRQRIAVVFVVAVAAIAAAVTLLPSGESGGGPAPAFAAALVRFANTSPLALLQLPGWRVVYADEESGGYGEMHFVAGPADADGTPRGASFADTASLAGRVAQLNWSSENAAERKFFTGGHQDAATGLGVIAHRFVQEGRGRGWLDISALMLYHGRESRSARPSPAWRCSVPSCEP